MAQPKIITESAPFDFEKSMANLDRQNIEFDAVNLLAAEWGKLRTVAVVDDDYPRMRHYYESALKTFIAALETNGRLPTPMLKLDVQAIAKIIGTSPSPLDTAEDKPCDRGCERPGGGTCICTELNMEAATRVVSFIQGQFKGLAK